MIIAFTECEHLTVRKAQKSAVSVWVCSCRGHCKDPCPALFSAVPEPNVHGLYVIHRQEGYNWWLWKPLCSCHVWNRCRMTKCFDHWTASGSIIKAAYCERHYKHLLLVFFSWIIIDLIHCGTSISQQWLAGRGEWQRRLWRTGRGEWQQRLWRTGNIRVPAVHRRGPSDLPLTPRSQLNCAKGALQESQWSGGNISKG